MNLAQFIQTLDENPDSLALDDTLAVIDSMYDFTPVAFSNGDLHNAAGEAVRSCRMYAFARRHGLTEAQTLRCFGEHYREVLADPDGTSHRTIRIFMKTGFAGLRYSADPLRPNAP